MASTSSTSVPVKTAAWSPVETHGLDKLDRRTTLVEHVETEHVEAEPVETARPVTPPAGIASQSAIDSQ